MTTGSLTTKHLCALTWAKAKTIARRVAQDAAGSIGGDGASVSTVALAQEQEHRLASRDFLQNGEIIPELYRVKGSLLHGLHIL